MQSKPKVTTGSRHWGVADGFVQAVEVRSIVYTRLTDAPTEYTAGIGFKRITVL